MLDGSAICVKIKDCKNSLLVRFGKALQLSYASEGCFTVHLTGCHVDKNARILGILRSVFGKSQHNNCSVMSSGFLYQCIQTSVACFRGPY